MAVRSREVRVVLAPVPVDREGDARAGDLDAQLVALGEEILDAVEHRMQDAYFGPSWTCSLVGGSLSRVLRIEAPALVQSYTIPLSPWRPMSMS